MANKTLEKAQSIIFSECKKMIREKNKNACDELNILGTELVEYRDSLGRVLCQDVVAKDPLPPFPASIKDGYAVIAQDGAGVRKVRGEASAGCDPGMGELTTLEVVRINTGAPVPTGADAVVMVEETKLVKKTDDGKAELEI
jgi:gephyrin